MTTDDVSWWPDLVPGQFVRHHLVLADGSSLSVQASAPASAGAPMTRRLLTTAETARLLAILVELLRWRR